MRITLEPWFPTFSDRRHTAERQRYHGTLVCFRLVKTIIIVIAFETSPFEINVKSALAVFHRVRQYMANTQIMCEMYQSVPVLISQFSL